jgi:Fe-S-cluster-containing dehydrogenase component
MKVLLQMMRRLEILDSEGCVSCQSSMLACTLWEGKASLESSRIRVRSAGGMEKDFTVTVIVCSACKDPSCTYFVQWRKIN